MVVPDMGYIFGFCLVCRIGEDFNPQIDYNLTDLCCTLFKMDEIHAGHYDYF